MEWYSALLIFNFYSPGNQGYKKRLDSLVVFKAEDFDDAHRIAIEIGTRRAPQETFRDSHGNVGIALTFCYVENLDIVGRKIGGSEVWSKLTDVDALIVPDPNRIPSQTI